MPDHHSYFETFWQGRLIPGVRVDSLPFIEVRIRTPASHLVVLAVLGDLRCNQWSPVGNSTSHSGFEMTNVSGSEKGNIRGKLSLTGEQRLWKSAAAPPHSQPLCQLRQPFPRLARGSSLCFCGVASERQKQASETAWQCARLHLWPSCSPALYATCTGSFT